MRTRAASGFFAAGLDVSGGAFFGQGFSVTGEFTLTGARLAADLPVRGSIFENPGGRAINLERASVVTLRAGGVSCRGQLLMAGAGVGGDVNLPGAVLETGDGEPALNAGRARIGGTLVLTDAKTLGEVNLRSIRVGGWLLLNGAALRDPSGMACRLSRAQVTADVFCWQMSADGQVKLTGATAGAEVAFQGALITCPAGTAIDAEGLRARELSPGPVCGSRAAWTSGTRPSACSTMIGPPGPIVCTSMA